MNKIWQNKTFGFYKSCKLRHTVSANPCVNKCIKTNLVYAAPIIKNHTGPTELLHIWFHLNTTCEDASWQVVIHYRNLCKKAAKTHQPQGKLHISTPLLLTL